MTRRSQLYRTKVAVLLALSVLAWTTPEGRASSDTTFPEGSIDLRLENEPERVYKPKKPLPVTISPRPTSSTSSPTRSPSYRPSTITPTTAMPSSAPTLRPSTEQPVVPTGHPVVSTVNPTTAEPSGTSPPTRGIFNGSDGDDSTAAPSPFPTSEPTENIFFGGSDGDDDTEPPSLSPTGTFSPTTSVSPTFTQAEWQQVEELDYLYQSYDLEEFGYTLSLSDDGRILTVGAPFYNETSILGGRIARYMIDVPSGIPTEVVGEDYAYIGFQSTVSGDGRQVATIDSATGLVEIYEYNPGQYQNTQSIDTGLFGLSISVALSGDGNWLTAVGEAFDLDSQETQAWILLYEYDEPNRSFVASGGPVLFGLNELVDLNSTETYGSYEIKMDQTGSHVIVSFVGADDFVGEVQVYERDGFQLEPIGQRFQAEGPGDEYGRDVDIVDSGTQLLMAFSVPLLDVVYVYLLNDSNEWISVGEPIRPDFAEGGPIGFGYACKLRQLDGVTGLTVSAPFFGNRSGAVLQYENIDGSWSGSGNILSGFRESLFGLTLACNRDCSLLAIGAPYDCFQETCGGSVYIFRDVSAL